MAQKVGSRGGAGDRGGGSGAVNTSCCPLPLRRWVANNPTLIPFSLAIFSRYFLSLTSSITVTVSLSSFFFVLLFLRIFTPLHHQYYIYFSFSVLILTIPSRDAKEIGRHLRGYS